MQVASPESLLATPLSVGAGGSSNTRASVVIVNYNGGQIVIDCLRSAIATLGPRDEIILVDNASTDGSLEMIRNSFPDLTVVVNVSNTGFGDGNNVGAGVASGEFLVFLNPDTDVEGDWISPLLDPLVSDSETGMTTSRVLLMDDPSRINTCGNDIHISGITMCRGIGRQRHVLSDRTEVGAVSGAAFAMRRNLFQRLDGFDGSFFMYMEDTDLSLRVRLAGYRVEFVPESIVLHHYRLKFSNRKVFYQERNRYQMLLKTLDWRTMLVLSPVYVFAELVTWGFILLRTPRQAAEKVRAYAWVVRSLPRIMRHRRLVQQSRQVTDRQLLSACTWRIQYGQVSEGWITRMSDVLLNPLIQALSRLSYALVR